MHKYKFITCIFFTALATVSEVSAMEPQHDYGDLVFECRHEADVLPPLSLDADALYKYGIFLEQQDGAKNFNEVAKYYRIAASQGHYKASTNLQVLISQGLASSPDPQKETIELVENAMAQGIPGAYYDMAHYLEIGYGVEQDRDKANAYFRKAADLGSPDAQFYVASMLGRIIGMHSVVTEMRRCAAFQGHRRAAENLAVSLRVSAKYKESVQVYQQGVKSGDSASARKLGEGFDGPPEDSLYYLGLEADKERSVRYEKISSFLEENEQLGVTLPDIDAIVPLPPAELPKWDGSFQWQKERALKVDPVKPSKDLVERLCKAKRLNPDTGLAL